MSGTEEEEPDASVEPPIVDSALDVGFEDFLDAGLDVELEADADTTAGTEVCVGLASALFIII